MSLTNSILCSSALHMTYVILNIERILNTKHLRKVSCGSPGPNPPRLIYLISGYILSILRCYSQVYFTFKSRHFNMKPRPYLTSFVICLLVLYIDRVTCGRQGIKSQCSKFRIKKLQLACQRIADNPFNIYMSGKVKGYSSKERFFRLIMNRSKNENTKNGLVGPRMLTIDHGIGESLSCKVSTDCINSKAKERFKSTSPWDYCQHYDPYR